MSELAERMVDAGWVLKPNGTGAWTVYASGGRRFHFAEGSWTEGENGLRAALEADEEAIAEGRQTAFLTRSRLSAAAAGTPPDPLLNQLCREGNIRDQTVIRFGGGRDRAGHDALVAAGAIRVEEVDPNFHPNPRALRQQYKLSLCLHVQDCLPLLDRKLLYQQVRDCTRTDGTAWFSFYGPTALPPDPARSHYEDGYLYSSGRRNTIFYKAYTHREAEDELLRELGGSIRHHFDLYHDLVYCWSPVET